jgi:hypothetical protein
MVVAFSAQGLAILGFNELSRDSFPAAFQHGMAAPWRARLLGDVGSSDPSAWDWGRPDEPIDVALLPYAPTEGRLSARSEDMQPRLEAYGHTVAAVISMVELPPPEESSPEPFGFEDGLSQPIIRGLREAPPAGRTTSSRRASSSSAIPTIAATAADDPRRRARRPAAAAAGAFDRCFAAAAEFC